MRESTGGDLSGDPSEDPRHRRAAGGRAARGEAGGVTGTALTALSHRTRVLRVRFGRPCTFSRNI